jgi:LysM repeat protein
MKRISIFLLAVWLGSAVCVRAEDAAVEERLNKLNGLVQDLIESKEQQRKQIAELSKQIEGLREQLSKPSTDTATRDELRKLAKSVEEVDRKRIEDGEKVAAQFDKLAKLISSGNSGGRKPPKTSPPAEDHPRTSVTPSGGSDTGFEYEIKAGDNLSTIVQAYRDQGVKVTLDQIYKANPGLKEKSLKVGQKIFIPKPPA